MKIKKIIVAALIVAIVCIMPGYGQLKSIVAQIDTPFTLVIDPGHGGPDSGAVSTDGTGEKDINLAIAMELRKEAEKYGVKVVMTRDQDIGLYDESRTNSRWTKLGDLKCRKDIIDKSKADLVVSIHLNSFISDTGVKGAQVFYPKNTEEQVYEENKAIAEELQDTLNANLSTGKERIVLPKGDIYLFKNINTNIVLVECGFLSNPVDLANLRSDQFQHKIAVYIMKSIGGHYSLEIRRNITNNVIDSQSDS